MNTRNAPTPPASSPTPATRWRCPKCGQTVTTYVAVSAPPTCTRHTGPPTALNPTESPTR